MIKILVIEDDQATRFLIKRILLKNFDCDVIEAQNGAVGIDLIMKESPELILLDISMPVMDGIETLDLIRKEENSRTIPVVVITAMNDSKVVSQLVQKGITDYLLKPIDQEKSVSRIKKILTRLAGNNGEANSKSKEHILLVDNDQKFRTFFNSVADKYFYVHNASNGADGLDLYTKFNPRHVFVSNELGLLDKKIITQKIREVAGDNEVSVYLLVSDLDSLSSKVFTYDRIIKKSLDKEEFLCDITNVKVQPPQEVSSSEENEEEKR